MARNVHTETVFADAIAIASPSEHAAFLDQACGADPGLRAEVERLVADHFRAGDFLEQPVVQIAAPEIDPLPFECPGTQIGPYVLLEPLGEGGMGVVYVAEQRRWLGSSPRAPSHARQRETPGEVQGGNHSPHRARHPLSGSWCALRAMVFCLWIMARTTL